MMDGEGGLRDLPFKDGDGLGVASWWHLLLFGSPAVQTCLFGGHILAESHRGVQSEAGALGGVLCLPERFDSIASQATHGKLLASGARSVIKKYPGSRASTLPDLNRHRTTPNLPRRVIACLHSVELIAQLKTANFENDRTKNEPNEQGDC